MEYRIVTDSSANVFALSGAALTSVPLKIVTDAKEYVDDPALDVDGMISELQRYKGKSGSSCPNVSEWLDAFAGADNIFVFTITRNLSGSYSAAQKAAETEAAAAPEKPKRTRKTAAGTEAGKPAPEAATAPTEKKPAARRGTKKKPEAPAE